MKVKIKKLHPDAVVPTYATDGSACFDLYALGSDWGVNAKAYGVEVYANRPITFRTDLAFEVPEGNVILVFSRSGHGFNNGVRLSNCVGVIDSDYRGELKVKLTADTTGSLIVNNGDRIAQAMLLPVHQIGFEVVDELTETKRGNGGFGSTGS